MKEVENIMLPVLFLDRMKEMLGDEYEDFISCFEKDKYQSLRINPLKGDIKVFLKNNPFHLSKIDWSEYGYYYEKEDAPGKHPYHDAGVYYIQEASAQMPVTLLEAKPGENILDLCSAPGGKATQIAGDLKGKGILICNEYVPGRAKILSENIERMGIRNAIVVNETPQHLACLLPGFFHRILVDAPCSGEGMFRKNEDARNEWSIENVKRCAERQDEILEAAVIMLMPGGKMVYSTCTFSKEEDEGSVQRLLQRHPEMHLVKQQRLWPHKVKGEGHFVAVLTKVGAVIEEPVASVGVEKGISVKENREFQEFIKNTLKTNLFSENDLYIKFGDQLYVLPKGAPSLKGMKVLRPGLHLGTFMKNRFEPSHALALFLKKENVIHSYELETEEAAVRYTAGNTFSAEGESGWYLITIHGYSIGWGKLAGGTMKNHYPKGLRK